MAKVSASWKAFELKIAKDFNTTRILQKGMSVPDVEVNTKIGKLVIDCKRRAHLSKPEVVGSINKYKASADFTAVVYRKNGARDIQVYMEWPDLIKLVAGTGAANSETLACIDYETFKTIVNTIGLKDA